MLTLKITIPFLFLYLELWRGAERQEINARLPNQRRSKIFLHTPNNFTYSAPQVTGHIIDQVSEAKALGTRPKALAEIHFDLLSARAALHDDLCHLLLLFVFIFTIVPDSHFRALSRLDLLSHP